MTFVIITIRFCEFDVCKGLNDRPNRAFLEKLNGYELLYKNGSVTCILFCY